MTTRLLLTCVLLLALTPLLACLPARAADDDPIDPALKRAGQPKISQKDLIRKGADTTVVTAAVDPTA